MINEAGYPTSVWDGTSNNRDGRGMERPPWSDDWDQIVAELIATQTECDRVDAAMLAADVVLTALFSHSAVADNSGVVIAGAPVYLKSAGTWAYADGDGATALRVPLGLLRTGGADSATYIASLMGDKLTLTTGEWDAVAGTTGGLTIGAKYYLSDTPGRLTETALATATDTLVVCGIALSATVMKVMMENEGLAV